MNAGALPEYDELFVVSDLHLGGSTKKFQIFCQGPRLAAMIRALAKRDTQRLALVLAGDIVDFLAAPDPSYLKVDTAVAELDRIRADDSFSMVFDALTEFVAVEGRQLVIVLGNHDVELALPQGRRWLYDTIGGEDEAARGRIELALDGWGYAARVGRKRVLVVHGNEVDEWNVIDHRALLEVNRAVSRGLRPEPWTPNGGTKLVIDLMNRVKARYPMVDLVKPETKAAVPIVAALDPDNNVDVLDFLRANTSKVRDSIRMATGFLGEGDEGEDRPPTNDELFEEFLAPALADDPGAGPPPEAGLEGLKKHEAEAAKMLWAAQQRIQNDQDPRDQEARGMLGVWDRALSFFSGGKPEELTRKALEKWLADDTTYDLGTEDATFQALDAVVGPEVDFLIAGHTHLHRALPRKHGRGVYFNSGTWIRLIRLSEAVLASPEQFARVWEAFKDGDIRTLDQLDGLGPKGDEQLVMNVSTVVGVHAVEDGMSARGQLYLAQDDGSLEPVKDSVLP